MTVEEEIAKKEKEFELAESLTKRVEALRDKQPSYFATRRKLLDILEDLEKQFAKHIQEEQEFLDGLPEKIKGFVEQNKEILQLRKDIVEMLKKTE